VDCVVGAGTKIGEKCSIKKSVIGRHCHIEDKVKIINSVIMNHVTISAGYEHLFLLLLRPSVVTRSFVFHRCTVNGSIICNNVHMKPGCTIKDSQIGVAYHVQEKGTALHVLLFSHQLPSKNPAEIKNETLCVETDSGWMDI